MNIYPKHIWKPNVSGPENLAFKRNIPVYLFQVN